MRPVTDPNLLAQLNGDSGKEVTDPSILAQLNGTQQQASQPTDNRRWDQVLSDMVTPTLNAVAPYTQQVASQPDFQPFPASQYGLPKPSDVLDTQNPSAAGQVLGTMRKMASLPGRFSNTLGAAVEPVTNAVNEGLAYGSARMGMPIPAPVTAGLGMAAGMASDPRNYIPTSGVSRTQPTELPRSVAESRAARTGVSARDFQRLYKDPSAIFAGGNVEQAGADIGAAKQAAGINPGVTNDLTSLTPENIDRINPTKAVKIEDINTVLGKISNGQVATPQEAQNALDSVNSILSQPSIQNNLDVFRQWSAIKTHINEALGQAAPDVRIASQAYAREKLGQTFSPMSAVNKSGTPSKLAMLAKQVPGAVGGAVGAAVGGPGGAAVGYEGGKMLAGIYHAPYVAGLQTMAGSYLDKMMNPVVSGAEKTVTSPAVLAYLQRVLSQRNQGNTR